MRKEELDFLLENLPEKYDTAIDTADNIIETNSFIEFWFVKKLIYEIHVKGSSYTGVTHIIPRGSTYFNLFYVMRTKFNLWVERYRDEIEKDFPELLI